VESQQNIKSNLKAQQQGFKRTQENEAEKCQEKGF
jgi:ribosomal protein S20